MNKSTKTIMLLALIFPTTGILSGYTLADSLGQAPKVTPPIEFTSAIITQGNTAISDLCEQVVENPNESYITLPGVGGRPKKTPTPQPTPCPEDSMCPDGVGDEDQPEAIPTIDLQSTQRELDKAIEDGCRQYQEIAVSSNLTSSSGEVSAIGTPCPEGTCPDESGIIIPPINLIDTWNQLGEDIRDWTVQVIKHNFAQ